MQNNKILNVIKNVINLDYWNSAIMHNFEKKIAKFLVFL